MIAAVAAIGIGATTAFFADTETSTGNTFTAGAIDLTVDSTAHYDGLICVANIDAPGYHWALENAQVPSTRPDLIDKACGGSWLLTNLGPTNQFFNISDLKPGDQGENTISLHVDNNDAYACADVRITSNAENSVLQPEIAVGDSTTTVGNFDGELAQNVNFFAWADNGVTSTDGQIGKGDNVWQVGEPALFTNGVGPASDVLGGKSYMLAGPGNALPSGSTSYIGLAWCAGSMTAVNGVITCNGAAMGNITQTDSMTADVTFRVEQARNNPNFTCVLPQLVE